MRAAVWFCLFSLPQTQNPLRVFILSSMFSRNWCIAPWYIFSAIDCQNIGTKKAAVHNHQSNSWQFDNSGFKGLIRRPCIKPMRDENQTDTFSDKYTLKIDMDLWPVTDRRRFVRDLKRNCYVIIACRLYIGHNGFDIWDHGMRVCGFF